MRIICGIFIVVRIGDIMNKKGFTLMELLTVIVVLGVIASITVPIVLRRIEDSTRKSFEVQAKIVLRTISDQMLEKSGLNPEGITLTYLKEQAKLSVSNYESLKVRLIGDKPFIILYGKNDWANLVAYGTYDKVDISSTSDYAENATAPTITLVGNSSMTVGKDSTYVESGATYSDDKDTQEYLANNYIISGKVKTSIPGDYILTYTIYDSSGNKASVQRTVTVLDYALLDIAFGTNGSSNPAKTRSTTVTVSGTNLNASSLKYLWSTATATPSEGSFSSTFTNGGNITSTSNLSGTYYLWILAKDTAGNPTIKSSKAFILDNEAPMIVMNGTSMDLALNSTYKELGAKAYDNIDGNITSNIVKSGTVNTGIAGTYTITYQATDTAGNSKTETRTVVVSSTTEGAVFTFGYTGAAQTFTVPVSGNYFIELWGAQGGNGNTALANNGSLVYGGKGAYVAGTISLTANSPLYVYVGSQGGSNIPATNVAGGYNGGGISGKDSQGGGGGGGATDIRTVSGLWNDTSSLRSRIIVAGGGGGSSNWTNGTSGGAGGALIGGVGILNPGSVAHTLAAGGTQTTGGAPGGSAGIGTSGGFGYGGNSHNVHGGGGGSGYYGGGGSGYISSGVSSGAGGSSFISGYSGSNAINISGTHTGQSIHYTGYSFINPVMLAGNQNIPTPAGGIQTGNSGNGYAKITYIKPSSTTVNMLIVAGGGGGGSYVGGGGGGGGVYEGTRTLSTGGYKIVVGAGGSGGTAVRSDNETNGENSYISGGGIELVALGGGRGARYSDQSGYAGGSGGGAGGCQSGGGLGGLALQPKLMIGSYGNRGGNMFGGRPNNETSARGGGGAGSQALDSYCTEPGDGGDGYLSSISGTPLYYGGGGGGGSYYPADFGSGRAGNGGLGGGGGGGAFTNGAPGQGGKGGINLGETPTLNMGAAGQGIGGAGGANTGGGGGGCGHSDRGGNGGSGIVIIRYPGPQRATGGTVTSSGGYTIHTFTNVGTSAFVLYK